MPKPDNATFISRAQAARILGVNPLTFDKLARKGLFGLLNYPGMKPRYRRADVEALAEGSVKPAGIAEGGGR
jgi:hypothetical protein